ncbi:MAG: hypothetical protein U1E81_14755 [Xanthobacteraceae bacterium]
MIEMLDAFPVIAMAAAIVFLPLLSEEPPRRFPAASDENIRSRWGDRSAKPQNGQGGTSVQQSTDAGAS